MNDTMLNNLAKQFESHGVIFWYDPSSAFSDQLDLMPDDVTLISASEYNDIAIKYRLLPVDSDKKQSSKKRLYPSLRILVNQM